MHLWEVDHPYHCNEGNYFSNDCGDTEHKNWSEFLSAHGESDLYLNLVFRWDWREEDPETGEMNFNGDVNYRNGKLLIFWMGQRKGLYRWSAVDVCRADEHAIKAWLQKRFDHMLKLWEPFERTAVTVFASLEGK